MCTCCGCMGLLSNLLPLVQCYGVTVYGCLFSWCSESSVFVSVCPRLDCQNMITVWCCFSFPCLVLEQGVQEVHGWKLWYLVATKQAWSGIFCLGPHAKSAIGKFRLGMRMCDEHWRQTICVFYTPPPFSLCFVVDPIFRHLENNRLERIEAADFPIVMNDLEELWVSLLQLCRESGSGIHPTHIQKHKFSNLILTELFTLFSFSPPLTRQ